MSLVVFFSLVLWCIGLVFCILLLPFLNFLALLDNFSCFIAFLLFCLIISNYFWCYFILLLIWFYLLFYSSSCIFRSLLDFFSGIWRCHILQLSCRFAWVSFSLLIWGRNLLKFSMRNVCCSSNVLIKMQIRSRLLFHRVLFFRIQVVEYVLIQSWLSFILLAFFFLDSSLHKVVSGNDLLNLLQLRVYMLQIPSMISQSILRKL